MLYRLHGTIQPYAWGGHDYIPQLLRREPSNLPAAELWFGDHPQAPSQIEADGITLPFNDWLQKNLNHALTPASRARFGDRLPYLLKILDVRLPLSIQVHPDKTQAEAGYAREEAAGISQGAANRNYPDDNHKPESMIALGDFWLLHGFAPLNTIEERLAASPFMRIASIVEWLAIISWAVRSVSSLTCASKPVGCGACSLVETDAGASSA